MYINEITTRSVENGFNILCVVIGENSTDVVIGENSTDVVFRKECIKCYTYHTSIDSTPCLCDT